MVIAIGEITIVNLDDVHISTTPPDDPVHDQLWLDTSTVPNVMKRWDATSEEWVKASPTSADDIGAETPEGAQDKADEAVREIADGEYPEGTFISGKSIYTPEVYAGHMHGLRGTFHDLLAGNAEGPRIEMGEKLIAAQAKVSKPEYAIASSYIAGHEPNKAFDGNTGTYWQHAVGDGVYPTIAWVGQEFPTPVCVKAIRQHVVGSDLIGSLQYYDEPTASWISPGPIEHFTSTTPGWHTQNVNPGNVYAKKWKCRINPFTAVRVYELEFYDERFSPFMDGYATKTQKAFELNAAGIGTFDGFFSMDGHPAGVIHEVSANDGGGYVKWSNGWAFCWATVDVSKPANIATGQVYRSDEMTWYFPIAFVNNSGRAWFETTSIQRWAHRTSSISNTSADFQIHRGTSSTFLGTVDAYAVGWWKEPGT